MRPHATARMLAVAAVLASMLAACSSGSGDGADEPASGNGDPAAGSECADAAGLTGAIEDRGTATATDGAITLTATEFAFSPTCVEAGGGARLEVTVTNDGSALHNLSVESLGIDEDVQAGETITVELTLPDSGSVPFTCRYHVTNGMQGAFLIR